MYSKKNNYTYYNKSKATKAVTKSTEVIPKYIQAYVKKAVSTGVAKTEEVKMANYAAGILLQGYNLGVLASSWYNQCVFPVCPYGGYMNIQQGSGQGDRAGNKIRTKKCVLDYVISPKQYDAVTNFNPQPFWVKMWIVTPKDDPTTLPTQASFANFIQNGDSSTFLSGAIQDVLTTVNTDMFRVHTYRNHKVGCAVDNQNGGQSVQQYFANNDFKFTVKGSIDVTKFIAKEFVFNDNAPYPNNSLAFVVMECVPCTGFTNSTQIPLNFVYSLRYEFTDA